MLQPQFFKSENSPAPLGGQQVDRRPDSGLFWWTIAITLLMALATFSWFSCIYLFRHPELPANYALLQKLKRIEPLQQFSTDTAPIGKYYSAKELYQSFYNLSDQQLLSTNRFNLRGLIKNFAGNDLTPGYLRGSFRVDQFRELTDKDLVTQGLVVRARSVDFPNVVAEIILPTATPKTTLYQPGDDITLTTDTPFATILHLDHQPNQVLSVTVLPIVYGKWEGSDPSKFISLAQPPALNLPGQWPLTQEGLGDTTVPKAIELAQP